MTPAADQIALDRVFAPGLRTSNRRLRILRSLFAAGGFLAALLLAEIGLRLFSYAGLYLWQWDDGLGWRGYPGAVGRSPESHHRVHLNSQGFHDLERSKQKPRDTLRIAVLGDSMTEAIEVAADKTFAAVLEQELAPVLNRNGRRLEVLNFGVRGYGTAQELLLLRQEVWAYDPDVVVLAFFSGNDVSDNSPVVIPDHSPRPYFVHRDGKLVVDHSYIDRESFFTRLRAWGKLHLRVLQVAAQAKASIHNVFAPRDPTLGFFGEKQVYGEPPDPAWQEAWTITEELIVTMRNEVAFRGAQFLLVVLSTPIQAHPDSSFREQWKKKQGAANLFYPNMRLEALAQRERIPMLDLARAFHDYAERRHVFLHGFSRTLGDGHFNEQGHRLAAELLARKIGQLLQGKTLREGNLANDTEVESRLHAQ